MLVSAAWQKTTLGPAVIVRAGVLQTTFLPNLDPLEKAVNVATVSLWEGLAGGSPSSRLQRWRWNRGARRLHREIAQAVNSLESPAGVVGEDPS